VIWISGEIRFPRDDRTSGAVVRLRRGDVEERSVVGVRWSQRDGGVGFWPAGLKLG
jgi:hypothetical protein